MKWSRQEAADALLRAAKDGTLEQALLKENGHPGCVVMVGSGHFGHNGLNFSYLVEDRR